MTTSKRQSHNKTRRVGSEPNLGQKAAEQEKKSKGTTQSYGRALPRKGGLKWREGCTLGAGFENDIRRERQMEREL
jgi:hypothetical protein